MLIMPHVIAGCGSGSDQVHDPQVSKHVLDAGAPPSQPGQPDSGPGSSESQHSAVTMQRFGFGARAYVLFEPSSPTPESAPVVVFLHAYGVVNSRLYGRWIEHIVRNGFTVVYPVYQLSLAGADAYTDDAVDAIEAAFQRLQGSSHVSPDQSGFALVGHSLGGVIAMNVGELAVERGLPSPKAILIVNTADANVLVPALNPIREDSYTSIPPDLLFLAVVGSQDALAGEASSIELFEAISHIPLPQREVVRLCSDDHGTPPLVANHVSPLSIDETYNSGDGVLLPIGLSGAAAQTIDTYDYYGYWKFLDGLLNQAFRDDDVEYALGSTTEQLNLGTWSDGVPVRKVQIIRP